jgi:hypothetical protein
MAIGVIVIVVIANTCIALKLSKRAKTNAWRVLNAMDRMVFNIFQVARIKITCDYKPLAERAQL